MRLILVATTAIALGACQQAAAPAAEEAAPAAPAAAPTAQAQPGTYEVTMKDGSKEITVIKEDGTYEDQDLDGKVTETGKWTNSDGKSCFYPDGGKDVECSTGTPIGPDGTFTATPEKGDPVTVKKIS
jgi:hypothetical protein